MRVRAKQYKDLKRAIRRVAQTRDEPVEGVVTALVADAGGVPYRATVQIDDLTTSVDILGWSHIGIGSRLSLESLGGLVSPRYRIREVLSRGAGVGSGAPGVLLNTPSIESLEAGTGLDPIPTEVYITPGGAVQARALFVVNRIPEQYRQRQVMRYALQVRKATGNQELIGTKRGEYHGWQAVGLVSGITAGETASASIGAIAGVTPQPDVSIPSRYGVVEIESEQIFYRRTNAAGTQMLTLTRGYNSTTPAAHSAARWMTSLTETIIINGLEPNTAYEARVRAEAADGRESTWSAWVSFTTVADTTPPGWAAAPTPTIDATPYQSSISWPAADTDAIDLSHYEIEYSFDGGATWQTGAQTKATRATLATYPGQSFSVRVRPVDTTGNAGNYSSIGAASAPLLGEAGGAFALGAQTMAPVGGRVLVGPALSILIAQAAAGATTIDVKHDVFATNEVLYLERAGLVEYIRIIGAATPITGGYRYPVQRSIDPGTSQTWNAGTVIFSTGVTGEGFIDQYAVQGINAASEAGPAIAVNVRTGTGYNAWARRALFGRLDGSYDYAAGGGVFGLAAGNPSAAWIGVDPINGFRAMYSTSARLQLRADGSGFLANGNIAWDTAGNASIAGWSIGASELSADSGNAKLNASASPFLSLGGATGYLSGAGFWVGKHSGVYKLHLGDPAGDHIRWDGTDLTITGMFVGASDIATTIANTFTINSDLTVTSPQLILGRSGGNASLTWNGTVLATDRPLSVTGAITATDDLAIGTSVLFVDVSQNTVGIATNTPDPQFALDVAGPCRAQWFIGPHAIQLKDVTFLAHYDGPSPFETNYAGTPDGHRGQVGTATGGVIYRPGMFGTKAVQIAQGTTNEIKNPSFELNITDNWIFSETGTGGSWTQDTKYSYVGSAALKLVAGTGNVVAASNLITVPAGASITAQCRAFTEDSPTVLLRVFDVTNGVFRATVVFTPGAWTWHTVSWTNDTGGDVSVRIYLQNNTGDSSTAVWIDAVQAELKAYATPYCDGSLGTGHSWTGTAHNSSSTRTAARLRYSVGGALRPAPQPGTVMVWFYMESLTGGIQRIVHEPGGVILRTNASGNLVGFWGTTLIQGGTVTAGVWHHAAISYDGSAATLYLDGQQVASGAMSGYVPGTTMDVGSNGGASQWLNGYVDDLVVLAHAADADEIRAVYESGAPVFAESATFAWRAGSSQLAWANDEGLFAVDKSGNAVLGVIGVDGKSWGGLTLDAGDVLIGGSASYTKWDASAATLEVKGTIKATSGEITGDMQIGTSGQLRSGATAVLTGNGYWLDYNAGTPRFRVGTVSGGALTKGIYWNGTDLQVAGDITATGGAISGTLSISAGGKIVAGTATELNSQGLSLTSGSGGADSQLKWYYGGSELVAYIDAYTSPTQSLVVYVKGPSDILANSVLQLVASHRSDPSQQAKFTMKSEDKSMTLYADRVIYTGYLELPEITAPAAPSANTARLFVRDNGSGKTQLAVRFPTGAIQILATEP